jgi:hypothetical protein
LAETELASVEPLLFFENVLDGFFERDVALEALLDFFELVMVGKRSRCGEGELNAAGWMNTDRKRDWRKDQKTGCATFIL